MATSIIKLHVFSGAKSDSPPCYLLQVDEFNFLLDCGWDTHFSMDCVKNVVKFAPNIDAILLSHSSMHHLGALPYIVSTSNIRCPIYATTPIANMGHMFLYDTHEAHGDALNGNEIFTLDDVDNAFDMVRKVKFHQSITLHGKGQGIVITALPAGHSLGGAIWKIMKDDYQIVYAIDYHHKRERHLNMAMFDACLRPDLLITDTWNALYHQLRRRNRDEILLKQIMQTLRRNGNVLITVDTAGRCLELAYLLETLWHNQESGLMAYGLVLLSHVSVNVVEFAKAQIEWMSDKISRAFEDNRVNPFAFRHMQMCHSMDGLKYVPEPRVILASQSDLEYGFSRQLFATMCENERNTIILTDRGEENTFSNYLIGMLMKKEAVRGQKIPLRYVKHEQLSKEELDNKAKVKLEKQRAYQQANVERKLDNEEESDDAEDDSESIVDQPQQQQQPMEVDGGKQHSGTADAEGNNSSVIHQSNVTAHVALNTTVTHSSGKQPTNWAFQNINQCAALALSSGVPQFTGNSVLTKTCLTSKEISSICFDAFLSQPTVHNHMYGIRNSIFFPYIEKHRPWDVYGEVVDPVALEGFRKSREIHLNPSSARFTTDYQRQAAADAVQCMQFPSIGGILATPQQLHSDDGGIVLRIRL